MHDSIYMQSKNTKKLIYSDRRIVVLSGGDDSGHLLGRGTGKLFEWMEIF